MPLEKLDNNKSFLEQRTKINAAIDEVNSITDGNSSGDIPVTATGTTTPRTLGDWVGDVINVKAMGAVGDGLADDTAAIQSAIDYLNTVGGGEIVFPKGEYLVIKLNPSDGGSVNPNDYAIHFYGSNITLRFEAGAKLIRDPLLPRYMMIRWGPLPIVNGQTAYENSHIIGGEFDGAYIINPLDYPDGMSIFWIHGLKDSSIRDAYVHNSSHYGLGLQNGGRKNFHIENVVIEDTLHDGIDIKNNGSNDTGTTIDKVTVRRFGRATDVGVPFAGIDCMGACKLSNIVIEDFGDIGTQDAGIRFKQGEVADDRGVGAHYSTLNGFDIKGNSGGSYSFNGVTSAAYGVKISQGEVDTAAGTGIRLRQRGCAVSLVGVRNSDIGFQTSDSTYTYNGDYCSFSECRSESSASYGYRVETTGCNFSDCISIDDNIGLDIRSGGLDTKWSGGAIVTPTSASIVNTGSNTFIEKCSGVPTEYQGESNSFAIDSTGTKSATVNHGLPFTPRNYKCSASLLRSVNSVYSEVDTIRVSGVSSTIVSFQINVNTSSPTIGDTATLGVNIDERFIPTGSI